LVGMVLPTMLDGAESWIASAGMLSELTTTYNAMIRSCMRMNTHTQWAHRITTESLLHKIGMQPLLYYLDWRVLGYMGHIARMGHERLPRKMMGAQLPGSRPLGAPPKNRSRQLNECLRRKENSLDKWEDRAQNRSHWREIIKKITCTPRAKKKKPSWIDNPTELLDCAVELKWEEKYYAGRVVDFDTEFETNERLWRVIYDDGDQADYYSWEISQILCLDEMGVF